MNIFVTGTDTDIGKTLITASLAAYLDSLKQNVCVFKPVQSGAEKVDGNLVAPDLEFVKSISATVNTKCMYLLEPPVAPSLAFDMAGISLDVNVFKDEYKQLSSIHDTVIVEGAGGLLAPVYKQFVIRDLIKLLNLPAVVVARPNLGTINHTLLTVECLKNHNIKVAGIIISGYPHGVEDICIKTAPKYIEDISGEKVLGLFPKLNAQDRTNRAILVAAVKDYIDTKVLFGV